MSETAIAGSVGLKLTLDTSSLNADIKKAASSASEKFSASFKSGGASAEKSFSDSFKGARTAADKTSSHFTKSFKTSSSQIEDALTGSFRNAESSGSSACESLSAMFSKVGTVIAAVFSIDKIKSFFSSAIEQAASLTAQESQMTQTFGEYESAASSAISRVADESGILETRLNGVGTQIYAFAKTSGMDSTSALDMMEEALQTAADSAAYYDKSLEDTADTLQSFLKGNYANDAALGVSATETTRNAEANKLYGKSFNDLSEAQKQLTLLQMVEDANELSGAMGQAAREADGWENVLGNLKEAWNQLLSAVGKPILQGAISVVKTLTTWLSKLAEYASAASEVLGELFGWSGDQTAATAANTADTASSIAESVENENALTEAVAKTNAEVKRGIAGFDKLNVISKTTTGSSGSSDSSGSTSGTSGTSGENSISASFELDTGDAKNKISEIKDKVSEILKPFVAYYNKYIKPIYEKVKKKIDELRDKLQKWWDTLDWKPLADSIETVLSKLEPMADVLLEQFGYIFENVLLPVGKTIIETILPTIISLLGNIIGMLTPIVQGAFNLLKPLWENILKPAIDKISEWFQKIGEKIGPKLEELGGKIGDALSKWEPIIRKISEVIGPVITKIIDFFGGSLGGALEAGLDSIGKIIDGIGGIADIIVGFAEGDNQKVTDGFRKLGEGILEALVAPFKHIWEAISGGLEGVGVDISGFFTGVWENITGFFSGVGEWFSDLWDRIVTGWHTVFDPWIEIFKRAKSWINTTVIQPIGNFFSDAWDKISKGAGQAWEGIKKAFSPVTDWFKNTFSNAWQGVKNVFSKGGEIFNGIKEGLFNAFKTVVNGLIDGINSIITNSFNALNNALKSIHEVEILGVKPFTWINPIDVPVIPHLATGGIVKAPTLAVVGDNAGASTGDPEVISPLSNLKSMLGASAGGGNDEKVIAVLNRIYELLYLYRSQSGGTQEVTAEIDGDELFKVIVSKNNLYKNTHWGRSAFA